MTESQQKLVEIVKKLGRRSEGSISVGPELKDAFLRQLKLDETGVDQSGTRLSQATADLLLKLQAPNSEIEKILRGQVMWYDVRSSVWAENPLLSVLFALTYAGILIERSGRKTGHTINIAVDCYKKHYESMSIFADTLIRTGIVKDGGGIIYWGVQNGGSIRNVAQYEKAIMGEGGNWIFGTMSHRPEDYVGAKFGMQGKVFCGRDLVEDFYTKFIKGDYPKLEKIERPENYVVTVGDLTKNNTDILEDLIRARTGTELPREKFLSGMRLGMNMCGSPVGKNLADIIRAFGGDIEVENDRLDEDFSIANIIDPNERESDPVEKMKEKAKEDGRVYLAVDPDGDRGTIVACDKGGEPVALAGTELLLLATENLATYNPDKLDNAVIYDMRTGLSISLLSDALKKAGTSAKIIAAEPGYPFFMELMGENKDAAIAVENTCHAFLTPFTNPIWGAPKMFEGVQGGDDAAVFLVYLIALSNFIWSKRNPIEQMDYLRGKYNIPKTSIREFKPDFDKKDAARKTDIAQAMQEIAKDIRQCGKFEIFDEMITGVRFVDKKTGASVLLRYSSTGPSFTASGEAINSEDGEFMFTLGGAVMSLAVDNVRKEFGNFGFNWNDYARYGDISREKAEEIIEKAKK